jgi:hypothetical protein
MQIVSIGLLVIADEHLVKIIHLSVRTGKSQ